METLIDLTPAISDTARQIDGLFLLLLGVCGAVAAGVFVVGAIFAYRFRHTSAPVGGRKVKHSTGIELVWTITPLAIFILLFLWAANLYAWNYIVSPPEEAMEIYVVGKQWMWKLQHPGGRREIDQLHVPRGRTVKLVMTSEDVIHSLYFPALRLKRDVLPGRYTSLWFKADKTGSYRLFCAEYCGTDHSRMGGQLVVMEPQEYARWVAAGGREGMAAAGERLFRLHGCSGCHGANATVRAPPLEGIYGKAVALQNGPPVLADERYLRDSILFPKLQVAAGYEPIMPSFQGQLSEEELLQLIAYIRSLATS